MYRSSENKKHQAYGSVREPVAKNWIWREKCLESCHSRPNLGLEGLASETPKQDLLTFLGYRPLKKWKDSLFEFTTPCPPPQSPNKTKHFSRVLFHTLVSTLTTCPPSSNSEAPLHPRKIFCMYVFCVVPDPSQ